MQSVITEGGGNVSPEAVVTRTARVVILDVLLQRFGHQDGLSSIDCLQRERPITAGTSDRSLRVWKVMEESQLVFHGHKYVMLVLSGYFSCLRCFSCCHSCCLMCSLTSLHTPTMMFRSSIDAVRVINEDHMISGSQDG